MGVDLLWHVDGDTKLDCSLHADGGHEVGWLPTYNNEQVASIFILQQTIGGQDAWAFYFSAGLGVSKLWSSWLKLWLVIGPAS